MGASHASNVSSQVSNAFFNVVNNAMETCNQTLVQSQGYTINGAQDSVIITNGITGSQNAQLSLSCLAKTDFQTNLQNTIAQTASAQAQAQTKLLGIGYSSSSNVAQDISNLGDVIYNEATQNCAQQAVQQQTVGIYNVKGSYINTGPVNWTQTFSNIQNCVQNTTAYTSAINKLNQDVNQNASATTGGLFGSFGKYIIIAIIIIVILVVIGGVAYYFYRKKQQSKTSGTSTSTTGTNQSTVNTTAKAAAVATPQGRALAAAGVLKT